LISAVVMFQAQNRGTINSTRKVAVFFKIIMTTSVTNRVSQHNIRSARPRPRPQCTRRRPIFWSQTGLVLRHHCSLATNYFISVPVGTVYEISRLVRFTVS